MLQTEFLYHERARGADPWPQDFWPRLDPAGCAALAGRTRALHAALVGESGLDDDALLRPVRYRTSAGVVHDTSPLDLLTHLALHGAHHRGQVASALVAAGHAAPAVDFIVFTREAGGDAERPAPQSS